MMFVGRGYRVVCMYPFFLITDTEICVSIQRLDVIRRRLR